MTTVGIYKRGSQVPDGSVYVGRGTRRPHLLEPCQWGAFGNPYRLPDKPAPADLRECLRLYLNDLELRLENLSFAKAVSDLRNKRLLCYCVDWDGDVDTILRDGVKCHGQCLAMVADGYSLAAIRAMP